MRIRATSAIVVGLSLVAACSSDKAATSSSATATSVAANEPTTAAADTTTVEADETTVETAVDTTIDTTADSASDSTTAPSDSSPATSEPASSGGVTIGDDGRLVQGDCVGDNTASEADGVAADSVNVATLSIDFAALAKIGFGITDRDPTGTFETYMNAANAAGGVCGRTINLQKIVYDVLQGQAGQACVEATEDRVNLLVNTASFDQPLCLTDAGLPTHAGTDLTEAQLAQGNGLIFSRSPLLEQQYKATVQHAMDEGALTGKVGVWYGTIFPSQGDAIEAEVLPMLDAAGIDYTAYRTDSAGPSDPEGNAILTSAATDFVGQGVDTVLMFVGPTNLTGMQNELHAQGLDPKYVSAPVNGNTSNEVFAKGFGTSAFTDGQEYVTFSLGASELDSSNPVAASCHKQWQDLTGETVEEKTFDYLLITSECVQADEVLAAMSIAGGDLTRASIVKAFEQVPAHQAPGLLGELGWTPESHGGSSTFSFQVYAGATNSVATDPNYFEVAP